jgi:cobalt-zinc-cadmium efflux system outer membrane protein
MFSPWLWNGSKDVGGTLVSFKKIVVFSFTIAAFAWTFPAGATTVEPVSSGSQEPAGVLTLEAALTLAAGANPELRATQLEMQAREANTYQAGLSPNPELSVTVDDIYGNKERSELSQSTTTTSLSQTIELGGKRAMRVELSSRDRELASYDNEAKRLEVAAETTKAFTAVVARQDRLSLTEDLVKLAQQSYGTVSARVQAGKSSPIDKTKAAAALALVGVEAERARSELETARKLLSGLWGNPAPVFTVAQGPLELDASLPSFEQMAGRMQANPDIARGDTEIKQKMAALNIQKAKRIPDPKLSAGFKYLNQDSETVFVAGLSVPLPLFDNNQGAVAEAGYRLAKAEAERKTATVKTRSALAEAYQSLSAAFAEASALKTTVIPSLQSAYEATLEGYRYGKFGFIDVLDTQRTLFESRSKYIETLTAYKDAMANVGRLTGGNGPILIHSNTLEGTLHEK